MPDDDAKSGMFGLTGWWNVVGNASAMLVIAVSFLFMLHTMIVQYRSDVQEERVLFRESLEKLLESQKENTGEIKKALGADTEATRALTEEIRRRTPPRPQE